MTFSCRLSRSCLWDEQRSKYTEFGPASWTQLMVPFQMTSNLLLAKQYAAAAREYLRHEAVTFLELGGGSGKFAYLFLQEMGSCRVKYVLTDLAEKNVAFWKGHPLLRPYFENGTLEAKVYDPVHMPYEHTGPLFVIANYFFDSIEHDLFRVENGQLFEGHLSENQTYSYHPVEAQNYYPEFPELNEVLAEYRETLSKANFLIPIGAVKTLRNVMPCTMLVGDKGFSTLDEIAVWEDPGFVQHGTFSFPVNFHALREYVRKTGRQMQSPNKTQPVFSVHGIGLKGKLPEAVHGEEPMQEQEFFPLCREEALLGHNFVHHWEQLGQPEKALAWKNKIEELQVLPRRYQVLASGDVLQIGEMPGISEAIRENKLLNHTIVAEEFFELKGVFDEIFFFAPRRKKKQTPSLLVQSGQALIRKIEEQFDLGGIVYSDQDLELFLQTHDRSSIVDPKHYVQFLGDLQKKKQITFAQKKWCLERLGQQSEEDVEAEEKDNFFEVLKRCLEKHMRKGSVFKACFPDTDTQFEN